MRRLQGAFFAFVVGCSASGNVSTPDVARPDSSEKDAAVTDTTTDTTIDTTTDIATDIATDAVATDAVATDAVATDITTDITLDTSIDTSIDTAADVASDAVEAAVDAPTDAAPACRSSTDCPSGTLCSPSLGGCIECLADAECPTARPVCRGGQCVARTVCTSSRMCPGGVCDTAAQSCVECSGDVDCAAGQRCLAHVCIANVECRSSSQCSARNMVCDTTNGRCVDCAADPDCATNQFCATGGVCHPRVCVPSAATCVDTMTVRACDARGSAETNTTCPSGQSCMAGRCVMRTCTPGSTECVGTTGVRRCAADGLGYEAMTMCPTGQACTGGACAPTLCTPDALLGCATSTVANYCTSDGMATRTEACPARPNAPASCSGGRCVLTCQSGSGNCDGVESNGCEVDLQTSTSNCGSCGRVCGAGQSCIRGACLTPGMCPSSCATNGDCSICSTGGDPGNYCCISGLCLYTLAACGVPTDAGTGGDVPDGGTSPDTGTCGGVDQPCCSGACTASNNICLGGVCRACPTGTVVCGSGTTAYCAATSIDTANCGACGRSCGVAGASCSLGTCYAPPRTCTSSENECYTASTPACVNLTTNALNCGRCGRACPLGTVCVNGFCGGACLGTATCASGGTTVCVDLQSDRQNCGACGRVCPERCISGVCAPARALCPVNRVDCTPSAINATCVDLQSSSANCGVCGHACPVGTGCSHGTCTIVT